MDFFSRQQNAQKKSRTFFAAFGLAMVVTVVIMYFGVYAVLILLLSAPRLSPTSFLLTSSLIAAVVFTVSHHKIKAIKAGGGAYMAESMGGELLTTSEDLNERQLINVVEEMAVASGLPRPRLYILRHERSINAVTAGLDYDDAVIVVTEGALTHLSREELQAVMAHEFAHILNGDFSLNLIMAGWLYGLLFIAMKGEDLMDNMREAIDRAFNSDSISRNEGTGIILFFILWLVGLVLMITGWISRTAAEIVQAAFSRQREYLADAFAVQFTRNPAGLAGALKKIAAFPRRGVIRSSNAMMMKAFFIVSPSQANGLLQTHPPLDKRILALEPGWDGTLPELKLPEVDIYKPREPVLGKPNPEALRGDRPKAPPSPAAVMFNSDWTQAVATLGLLAAGGSGPGAGQAGLDLASGARLYEAMPDILRGAADDPELAVPLTAAVFISDQPELAGRQLTLVRQILGEDALKSAAEFKAVMAEKYKFPLLSLLSPTLKQVDADRRMRLGQAVKALAAADGRLDLFEIAACQILKNHLGLQTRRAANDQSGGVAGFLKNIQRDAAVVVSIMAGLDSKEPEAAFAAGMAKFTQWPHLAMAGKEVRTSGELVRALDRLGYAPAAVKKTLMLAAMTAAMHDRQVTAKEYTLLRALSAAVDIPLPFMISS